MMRVTPLIMPNDDDADADDAVDVDDEDDSDAYDGASPGSKARRSKCIARGSGRFGNLSDGRLPVLQSRATSFSLSQSQIHRRGALQSWMGYTSELSRSM